MTDFSIAPPTRHCTLTGRTLAVGERFVAALIDTDGTYTRHDYALDAWPGPPANTVAFWRGKVAESHAKAKPAYNDELLAEWFQHLGTATDLHRMKLRFVVALLLMRRKRLKFEDTKRIADAEVLIVRDTRTGARHEVTDPRLNDDEFSAVEQDVFQALGWN